MEDNIEPNNETENAALTLENLNSRLPTFEIPEINKHEYEKWLLLSVSYSVAMLVWIKTEESAYSVVLTVPADFYKVLKNLLNRKE